MELHSVGCSSFFCSQISILSVVFGVIEMYRAMVENAHTGSLEVSEVDIGSLIYDCTNYALDDANILFGDAHRLFLQLYFLSKK